MLSIAISTGPRPKDGRRTIACSTCLVGCRDPSQVAHPSPSGESHRRPDRFTLTPLDVTGDRAAVDSSSIFNTEEERGPRRAAEVFFAMYKAAWAGLEARGEEIHQWPNEKSAAQRDVRRCADKSALGVRRGGSARIALIARSTGSATAMSVREPTRCRGAHCGAESS
jgi:hypothetical protein